MQKLKEQAIEKINNGEICCGVIKDGKLITSSLNGIKPLMTWLNTDKEFFCGCEVIDKIIGKAAALLLVLGKVKAVHGEVMSDGAIAVFEEYKILYTYEQRTTHIKNRTNTGICPMEQTVQDINSPETAYIALREKIKELMKSFEK